MGTKSHSDHSESIEKWASAKKESFKIFDQVAKTYDLLNRILSLGIDVYWRKKLVRLAVEKNNNQSKLNVLDLACGTGDLTMELAKACKVAKVTGLDMSQGMLAIATEKKSKDLSGKKIQYYRGDATSLPLADQSVDLCTIAFGIRNFSDPVLALKEMKRVLRPGGSVAIIEFALPQNFLVRAVYLFYFRHVLPTVGRWISKNKTAYSYLNQTVEEFPYGNSFVSLMQKAGLQQCQFQSLTFGIAHLYLGRKD